MANIVSEASARLEQAVDEIVRSRCSASRASGALKRKRVAIVGSGPTALYALQDLIKAKSTSEIVIFEASDVAGRGTPYQRGINDPAMLSNIPSVEIPDLPQSLVVWLAAQPKEYLADSEIECDDISDRAFYPRVVIGDYFRAQFETLIAIGEHAKHTISVREGCRVLDIARSGHCFEIQSGGQGAAYELFDYVIVATGHSFPSAPEISTGYFTAPWPATALHSIPCSRIGILGTSLSAIDAVMTIATAFGSFTRSANGCLDYRVDDGYRRVRGLNDITERAASRGRLLLSNPVRKPGDLH